MLPILLASCPPFPIFVNLDQTSPQNLTDLIQQLHHPQHRALYHRKSKHNFSYNIKGYILSTIMYYWMIEKWGKLLKSLVKNIKISAKPLLDLIPCNIQRGKMVPSTSLQIKDEHRIFCFECNRIHSAYEVDSRVTNEHQTEI